MIKLYSFYNKLVPETYRYLLHDLDQYPNEIITRLFILHTIVWITKTCKLDSSLRNHLQSKPWLQQNSCEGAPAHRVSASFVPSSSRLRLTMWKPGASKPAPVAAVSADAEASKALPDEPRPTAKAALSQKTLAMKVRAPSCAQHLTNRIVVAV